MFEKIEVYKVGYNEIEKLINENLFPNKKNYYDLLDSEEDGNFRLFEINKELKYDFDKDEIKKFLDGYTKNNLRYGMIELCRRDIIPEGNYLIDLSW